MKRLLFILIVVIAACMAGGGVVKIARQQRVAQERNYDGRGLQFILIDLWNSCGTTGPLPPAVIRDGEGKP
ncbi:MAG TPA: hypothetical protein VMS17_25090, partial [Gemmataceae bacterium]|nr:hypothetical protein [Gemmataceae bacterium]